MIDDIVQTVLAITLPFPPSVNNAYATIITKSGKMLRKPTRRVSEYKHEAGWLVLAAANEIGWRYHLGQQIKLTFTIYFPEDGRRHDLTNCLKIPEDAISDALHFDDDYTIVAEVCARVGGVDKRNPRCEVQIEVLS